MSRRLLTYFNALDDLAEEIPRPNIDGARIAHEPHYIVLGAPNIELVNRLAQEFHQAAPRQWRLVPIIARLPHALL